MKLVHPCVSAIPFG